MGRRTAVALCCLLLGLVSLPAGAYDRPVFDGDADGIPDDRDACPYSTRGPVVGPNGCSTPGDEDEDGVADVVDACPLSPVGASVDAQGCALDRDVDGIADGVDVCPATRLGMVVDARGCGPGERPVAGLPRPRRMAPTLIALPAPTQAPMQAPIPAPAPVLAPDTAPVASPAAAASKPTTPPAPRAENVVASTAAAASPDPRGELMQTFHFDAGSAALSWGTQRAAKKMAATLQPTLAKDSRLVLVLSGHADTKSDGVEAARLATARAAVVRDALVAAGLPVGRIALRVPGVNEPRFQGEQLEKNCRAELRLQVDLSPPVASTVVTAAAPPSAPLRVPSNPVVAPTQASAAASPVAAKQGTAPLPRRAVVSRPPQPTTGPNTEIAFAPYSAVLDDDAIQSLGRFVQTSTRTLLADSAARVVVISGVDAGETGAAALQLAESRAASVLAYLVTLGLPRNRLEFSTQAQTGTSRAALSVASG